MTKSADQIHVRWLGKQDYATSWQAMRDFTNNRDESTPDEVWLLEHPPVFTQGQNGKPEHVLNPGDIPVIKTDRGGQVTYHGPGQLMIYTLIDLRRRKLNVRELVTRLENSVIDFLSAHSIQAEARRDAPGVYVNGKKIASIGLRVRKGCSYHGIAFNINMNLEPFSRINPCGFARLEMTQLVSEGVQSEDDHPASDGLLRRKKTLLAMTSHTDDVEMAGREYINFLVKQLEYEAQLNKES